MVLGWLPFHLGGTGNDQPDKPAWNIVDLPPYPQMILGYTNETLRYPWVVSYPSKTPWAIRNGSYEMYANYETPWITERLEADSCKFGAPFILANDTRRAAFNQKM